MSTRINVYSLPKFVEPEELARGTVVVLDVLRASTTMIYALNSGAKTIIPCREVDEARALARQYARGEAILGGERGALPITQFDLGNSPGEYTPEMVKDKTIIFTTTNGTQVLHHARLAKTILIGAFVNATAIIQKLLQQKQVHLLCAGAEGQLSEDDILLAGMLVDKIQREGGASYKFNAQAIASQDLWLHTFTITPGSMENPPEPERLAGELQKSRGGKNLMAVGLEKDILAAARIDRFQHVPQFHPKTSRIQLTE